MTIGYTRVSTSEQNTAQQVEQIESYCYRNNLKLDDVIEVVMSSRKDEKKRELDKLNILKDGDSLIVVALDRLGRSTLQVLKLLEELSSRGVRIHIINEKLIVDINDDNPITKMTITIMSAFAELERSFISKRTKAALAQKKREGVILGRPKGSRSLSMYDKDKERIKVLLSYGVPISKIIDNLGYGSRQSLTTYIRNNKAHNEK